MVTEYAPATPASNPATQITAVAASAGTTPPLLLATIYFLNNLSDNPRQLHTSHQVRRVRELLRSHGGVQLELCWHIDMDILVSDLKWKAGFGPPHAIEDVDGLPDSDAVFALDGVDALAFGDVVV